MELSLFSSINRKRSDRWHPLGINSWSLSDWYTAFMGEAGEAGNVIKKMNRMRDNLTGNRPGYKTHEELTAKLAEELADAFIYLDLVAQAADIDLEEAVRLKFNKVSIENDFPERL